MANGNSGEARRSGAVSGSLMALAPGAFLMLFGAAAVTLYAALFAPLLYPFGGDSPAYVEAARSLLAGEPLLYSRSFGYDGEVQIFRLWPPGFPVLIAAVASAGMDAGMAALWLTRLSVALLPLAAYWAIYGAVGVPIAIGAALLSFSAVGMLPYAHYVSSDAPFALVAILSVGFLMRGLASDVGTDRSSRLLFTAGLLAALAISIRNSGIALVLAEVATIAALWLAKDGSFMRLLRPGLTFAAGLGLGLLPLMIWNLAAFGVLRPYNMPPSTVGIGENVENLMRALLSDLLAHIHIGGGGAPFLASLAVVGILAIVGIGVAQLRGLRLAGLRVHAPSAGEPQSGKPDSGRMRGAFLIFAACYGLIAAIVTILARSRYEWGEHISERHVAQFDWLLVAAALCAFATWLNRGRATLVVVASVVACLLGLRAWYFIGVYNSTVAMPEGRQPLALANALAFSQSLAAANLIAGVPSHCVILSNAAEVIRVTYKRRSRQVRTSKVTMEVFADLAKPSVLIFVAMPGFDIRGLEPPGPGYRTIRDPLFVAFLPEACGPGVAAS